MLSQRYGVSCIVAEGLEIRPVTAEFQGVEVSIVMSHLAKRLGVEVRKEGNVYYVGELAKEDRGVLVRRVRRLEAEEIEAAVQTVLSDDGQVAAFTDGLLVVSDSVGVLDRVRSLLEGVEQVGGGGWVLQMQVIAYGETAADELGIEVIPAGRLAASVAGVADWSRSVDVVAELEATLTAIRDRADVLIVADPVLLVSDGRKGSFRRVENVPYETSIRETSSGASVTTEVVEFLEIGFTVDASLRETGPGSARVEIHVTNSSITSVGESDSSLPPTVAKEDFSSVVPVEAGGVYLVGAFQSVEERRGRSLGFTRRDGTERRTYQVWLTAHQIDKGLERVTSEEGRRTRSDEEAPMPSITPLPELVD